MTLRGTKNFLLFDIKNDQKKSPILAYQTFSVKPCYNCFMGRNYFSKHGGPYFINDGLSKHDHDHKPGSNHEHIKPDPSLLVFVSISVLALLSFIGIMLATLH